MQKRRIKAKVADLVLNEGQLGWLPRNPRQWTRDDINLTKQSLERDPDFQEDKPILVTPLDKKLLVFAGNLRTTAAKQMKLQTFEAIEYIPESDEDYETIKRRAMLDNGSFGSWDTDVLANEWDDCPLADWGVPEWVTDVQEEEQAPAETEEQAPAEVKEDDFDEDKDHIEVRCKKGDVWELGEHRLMCGDSTDLEQVKTLMDGKFADMLFTDPPYGTTALVWDNDIDLKLMFDIAISVIQEKAQMVITGAQPFVTDLINAGRKHFRYEIIWKKTQPSGFFQANKAPLRIHENILVFGKGVGTYNPQKSIVGEGTGRVRHQSANRSSHYHGNGESEYVDDGTRYPTSVIEVSNWNGALFGNTDNAVKHPTQKPLPLADYFIKTYSNDGEIVLDLFGGSGTTLIAAEQLGRKCYMMELDPHYCDVIIARWEKLTGKEAVRIAQTPIN